ncbi:MAG: GDP-mannose 4,6-dehydratase, partial [Verrucomicrobiae bacterium]|nr:GDP-mannose 4,6-dehydratase [Verrucomicrobiae bacterium]
MRVLITGGAGFIGSHLAEALLAQGDEIAVLDNFNDFYDPGLKRENWQLIARAERPNKTPAPELLEADLCDAAAIEAKLKGRKFDQIV